MSHITKIQTCPYGVKQMFDLVADFESYPQFMPFCSRASSQTISVNEVYGTLFINKGIFKKSFTTHNHMHRTANPARIDIQLVNGPFRRLHGQWCFHPTENGCQVTLDLTYDMKSGLLNQALASVFEWIAQSMVEAFCQQAHKIYD